MFNIVHFPCNYVTCIVPNTELLQNIFIDYYFGLRSGQSSGTSCFFRCLQPVQLEPEHEVSETEFRDYCI